MSSYVGCGYTHGTWGSAAEVWRVQSAGPSTYDHFATPEGKKSPLARIFSDGADHRAVKRMCAVWDADQTAIPDYDAILRDIKIEDNEPVMLDEVVAGMVVRISHNLGTEAGLVEEVENRGGDLFMSFDCGTHHGSLTVGWAQERLDTDVPLAELNRERLGNIGFERESGRPYKSTPSPQPKGGKCLNLLELLVGEARRDPQTITLAVYGWLPDDANGYPRTGPRGEVIGQYRLWREPGTLHIRRA